MRYIFDALELVTILQRELIRMSNQDYDLDELIYQYLNYRARGDLDIRNYRLRSGVLDNEDAEILYFYTLQFYREIDQLISCIEEPILNLCLSKDCTTLIVFT